VWPSIVWVAREGAMTAPLATRLAAGETVVMPGVWDAWSALVARRAGFDTVFVSGYAVSGTLLGRPDAGLLGQTEVADVARRVCAAVPDVDVVVDADTGYGNAMNVRRTVELWEAAGAAGLFLEDQTWPKRCGHQPNKDVVSADEWLAKVRAAVESRTSLFVTARTDARGALGLDEAIDRGRRARDVGADAVFVEAPATVAELETIARALPDVPLVANMAEKSATAHLSVDDLRDLGFRLLVSPVTLLLAATVAADEAARHLRTTGRSTQTRDRFDDFDGLVGLAEHREVEERYRT